VMATSLLTLGRISQVSRPAIASLFPTSAGRPTVVLDVGANAENKPQHLAQFAVMGSVYASIMPLSPSSAETTTAPAPSPKSTQVLRSL